MKSFESPETRSGMVALSRWCENIGRSSITAWRFRKRGWLKTINIAGRVYVSESAAQEFARRAEAGEFAREPKVPRRP
jgi:predicted site-specific integrase-resolvase